MRHNIKYFGDISRKFSMINFKRMYTILYSGDFKSFMSLQKCGLSFL